MFLQYLFPLPVKLNRVDSFDTLYTVYYIVSVYSKVGLKSVYSIGQTV